MTDRDTIIRMAVEAGWRESFTPPVALYRFASLVAAAEREACAQLCQTYDDDGGSGEAWGPRFAAAIRARGQPTQRDALNAWARDRLARHGIPMPDDNPSF